MDRTEGDPPGPRAHDHRGDRLTITLAEDIDRTTAAALSADLLELIAGRHPRRVIVDVAGVQFCDLPGARMLIDLRRALAACGRSLHLRGPRPHLRWLLHTLDAGDLLESGVGGGLSPARATQECPPDGDDSGRADA